MKRMPVEPTAFDAAPHPRFSVLMAAFQAEATVARAVRSVLAQTRDDWELIVIDDGSADSTAERVRAAAAGDSRVRVLVQDFPERRAAPVVTTFQGRLSPRDAPLETVVFRFCVLGYKYGACLKH